jgi:stress response protein YsnF
MLRNAKNLIGHKIRAANGELEKVDDLYFDDDSWIIRYFVIETGSWFSSRKILIASDSVVNPDWENKILSVSLTREQVEKSPSVDLEKPVSRQAEERLRGYYAWPLYWGEQPSYHPTGLEGEPLKTHIVEESSRNPNDEENPQQYSHLRSYKEVTGYRIQGIDDEIGHVEDFLIQEDSWNLQYLIIDTRNVLPGKKVLIATSWVEDVNWSDHVIMVSLPREQIRMSPEYHASEAVTREYEERLLEYYGAGKHGVT